MGRNLDQFYTGTLSEAHYTQKGATFGGVLALLVLGLAARHFNWLDASQHPAWGVVLTLLGMGGAYGVGYGLWYGRRYSTQRTIAKRKDAEEEQATAIAKRAEEAKNLLAAELHKAQKMLEANGITPSAQSFNEASYRKCDCGTKGVGTFCNACGKRYPQPTGVSANYKGA